MSISNYWKDNQKESFASDYPFMKKMQLEHQEEIKKWKEYYKEIIKEKDDILRRQSARIEELTAQLEELDQKNEALFNQNKALESMLHVKLEGVNYDGE